MLDDAEWEQVAAVWRTMKVELSDAPPESFGGRPAHEHPLVAEANQRMLEAYVALTGHQATNAAALWHHRLSLHGPPCAACGHPLRTPKATFCADCGAPRVREEAV